MRRIIIVSFLLAGLVLFGAGCGEETISFEQTIEVNSASAQGTKFVAPESGYYELSYNSGVYRYLPEDDVNWSKYGGWRTRIDLYVNRAVEWGAEDEWGKHAISSDDAIGPNKAYATSQEAGTSGKDSKVEVYLEKGEYIIAIVSDGTETYFDNFGTIKIDVVGF